MGARKDIEDRRNRSKQERRLIVEASLRSGESVAAVARAHGVRPNQIFHWRKLDREGRLGAATAELLPVRIAETEPRPGSIAIEAGRLRSPHRGHG